MTVRDLLAEILADPDADELRQVYADQLLASGDPRGELIQVQVAREATAEDDPAWAALRRRELQLLARHEETWLAPLGGQLHGRLRRGFLEELGGHADNVVRIGPALLRREPITVLAPTVLTAARLDALWAGPILPRIRDLRLIGASGLHPRIAELFGAGQLAAVTALSLAHTELRGEGVEPLAASPLAPRLRALDLSYSVLGEAGVAIVLDGRFAGLERLGVAAAYPLAAALHRHRPWPLPTVRALTVDDVVLAEDGAAALVRALPALEELRANRCQLAGGVAALAGLPRLRHLDVRHSGAGGVAALAVLATLPALAHLDLGGARHGVRVDLDALASSPWPALRSLGLDGFELDGCEALAGDSDGLLQRLTCLDLSHTGIGDGEVRALTSGRWPRLHTLVLRGNRDIGFHGARLLTEAEHLPSLVHLDLRDTGIVERGRKPLRARYRTGLQI